MGVKSKFQYTYKGASDTRKLPPDPELKGRQAELRKDSWPSLRKYVQVESCGRELLSLQSGVLVLTKQQSTVLLMTMFDADIIKADGA